jgi:ribonuclease D
MFKTEINKQEINSLELFRFEGEIIVIDSPDLLNKYFREILASDLVGFDSESKPSFTKGIIHNVSLIQIATATKVFLIRINKTGFTQKLHNYLNNIQILKVGIGLDDDIQRLSKFAPVQSDSFFDLNTYCHELGFKNVGARNLSALILNKRISKNQQTSNWEANTLSEPQLRYAATDAWICREIYLKLKSTDT